MVVVVVKKSKLNHIPEFIAPPGYLSYQPYLLGNKPVLSLFAGGLKVGEVMARLRLKGLDAKDAAAIALKNPLLMDFPGENAWI